MARRMSDILAGTAQGAFQGGATGAMFGPKGAAIGAIGGGLMGLVMGLAAEDDPAEALKRRLANENLQLTNEEKKMVIEQAKKQQQARKKIGQGQANYMKDFFGGARLASTMTPAPTTSQRLYGVE